MELKRLGDSPNGGTNNIVKQSAAGIQKPAAEGANINKPSLKKRFIFVLLRIIFFYMLASFGIVAYQSYSTQKFREKIAAERAEFMKAYEAQQAQLEQEKKAEGLLQRRPELSVYIDPAQETEVNTRVSSTDLFLQSVKSERVAEGIVDQTQQEQVLDYGAQVAAYDAQIKAQEEAEAAKIAAQEAQRRAQEQNAAYSVKQYQAGQVQSKPKTVVAQPKKVQQQKVVPPNNKKQEQGTQVKKLETRRIFK